jgi:putative aminopeptidase FrvX
MVAAVMLPAASLVKSNLRVPVPDPFASVPLIGGTSLDGSSAAVTVTEEDDAGEGVVGGSSPHAVARDPRRSNPIRARDVMTDLSCDVTKRISVRG